MIIKNCNLTGGNIEVNWDADASKAVLTVAKALLNLTELFVSQQITIGPMINIGANGIEIMGETLEDQEEQEDFGTN
jgi:hypothetical protein